MFFYFFLYSLELNNNRRRLTWQATPRSILEGVAPAIMSSDCLVFDTNIAQIFTDNGNLAINVTISLCWPPSHLFQLLAITCLLLMMVMLPYSLFIFFRFYLTSRSELGRNFICGNCFSKRNIWYCKTR